MSLRFETIFFNKSNVFFFILQQNVSLSTTYQIFVNALNKYKSESTVKIQIDINRESPKITTAIQIIKMRKQMIHQKSNSEKSEFTTSTEEIDTFSFVIYAAAVSLIILVIALIVVLTIW